MTETEILPAGEGEELPEGLPRPRRWWIAGVVLLVAGALLATFIPGLIPRERTGSGTGFVVAEGGYILTAAHVVREATEITVHWDGRAHSATVIAISADHDLALLVSANLPPAPVATLAERRPELGARVITVGHPGGALRPRAHSTTVAGVGWWAVGAEGAVVRDLIVTHDPFRRGSSGAPLADDCGQIVGVVTGSVTDASGEEFGFAVSIQRAADWLADRGMTLPVAPERPSSPLNESEVVSLLSPSVVRIEARLRPGSP